MLRLNKFSFLRLGAVLVEALFTTLYLSIKLSFLNGSPFQRVRFAMVLEREETPRLKSWNPLMGRFFASPIRAIIGIEQTWSREIVKFDRFPRFSPSSISQSAVVDA